MSEPETRRRTPTEKGLEYQLELLHGEFRKAHTEWSKQINSLRASISDSDDAQQIRKDRSDLETRFEILSTTWDRLEDLYNKNSDIDISKQRDKFDIAELENNEALKCASKRLLEIKSTTDNVSVTSRGISERSWRSRSSNASSKSFYERKIHVATKLARLTAELKLADTERRKEVAFHSSQRALKNFKLEKGFELARAEMNALLEIGGTDLADLPEDTCKRDQMNEYLETQANSVTIATHDNEAKQANPHVNTVTQSTIQTIKSPVKMRILQSNSQSLENPAIKNDHGGNENEYNMYSNDFPKRTQLNSDISHEVAPSLNPFLPERSTSTPIVNNERLYVATEFKQSANILDAPMERTHLIPPLIPSKVDLYNNIVMPHVNEPQHRNPIESHISIAPKSKPEVLVPEVTQPTNSKLEPIRYSNPFKTEFIGNPKAEFHSYCPNPFTLKEDFIDFGQDNNDGLLNDNKPELSNIKIKPPITNDDAIVRLVDLLSRRKDKEHLPKREPEVFDGNLMNFPVWLKSFETLVENQTSLASERIYYLGRYTSGIAHDSIVGFLALDTDNAYHQAKTTLKKRFGDTFLVSDAYRKRINDWPKVSPHDGASLRAFADFLESCRAAMSELGYLKVLNDPDENQRMLRKLPSYLKAQWSRIVDKWLEEESTSEQGDRSARNENVGYPPFAEFCKFLQREARIACNPVTSFQALRDSDKEKNPKSEANRSMRTRRNVASTFATGAAEDRKKTNSHKETPCPACQGPWHELDSCEHFLKLKLNERKELARSKALCWGCLRHGHVSKQCRKKLKCKKCDGPHPTSLHDDTFKAKGKDRQPDVSAVVHRVKVTRTEKIEGIPSSHSLIVPVWLSHKDDPEQRILVYALLDEQSDACFIQESLLNDLHLKATSVTLKLSTMLGEENIESHKVTGLLVKGVGVEKEIPLPKVYTRETVPAQRGQIPRRETALRYPHLRKIADQLMPYRNDIEIALLIGLNCAPAIKPREVIIGNENDPYAKRTALGWGIIGIVNPQIKRKDKRVRTKGTCHLAIGTDVKEIITPEQINKMFEADFSEKEKETKPLSQEDRQFLRILDQGTCHRPDGHYEMPLPFRNNPAIFDNNRSMALARLVQLKKRLQSDPKYRQDYNDFMSTIINSGHAEKVQYKDLNLGNGKVWYVPHHGVYHPKKPGKIRVVFDCSASLKGKSLNRELLQGPDLINNLVGVLCRFRKEPIAFMCDVEKMFHQVKVTEDCRDYLRFLWWEDGDVHKEPAEYRMAVHLFGAVSSPGCANYAFKRVAQDFAAEHGEQASKFIQHDFYVDDGLKSVPTAEEAISLIENTKKLCEEGKFNLHKFTSNSREVIQSIPKHAQAEGIKDLNLANEILPIERALGVQWCIESDTFHFRVELKDRPCTRRGVLSTVSSIFDPLGLVAPVILVGKKILQELCKSGIEWDEKIPDSLRPVWEKWRRQLCVLAELKISRCFKPERMGRIQSAELHSFSDASQGGYGQCSYLRLVDEKGDIHCSLVMAKSRVTPLKSITIPRLELSAALVSVRVSALLRKELEYDHLREVYWTDSKVVLGYIGNVSRRFHVFVANRVQQILEETSPKQWNYVDTKDNPADDASRGLDADEIVKSSRWWKGPEFLWSPNQSKTEETEKFVVSSDDPEIKKTSVFSTAVKEHGSIIQRLSYFSDLHRAKKR